MTCAVRRWHAKLVLQARITQDTEDFHKNVQVCIIPNTNKSKSKYSTNIVDSEVHLDQ